MAGQVAAILRRRVEIAERDSGDGDARALREARENLLLALEVLREKLQPIESAASQHDIAWLAGAYPNWVSERRLLRDEVQSLRHLLEHVDLVLAEGSS